MKKQTILDKITNTGNINELTGNFSKLTKKEMVRVFRDLVLTTKNDKKIISRLEINYQELKKEYKSVVDREDNLIKILEETRRVLGMYIVEFELK